MAMKAMYNAGAQLSLAQMNKNITKAGNALAKLSAGERKIGAQEDDSASFGISEKMREQIRSLLQDNQNVQNGSSMLRVAERGVDQIVQELDRLKRLAINSANDSNTDDDRRTIQKEFNSCLDTINDIAIGTEYNGQRLLDGTWARKKIPSGDPGDPIPALPGDESNPTIITGSTTITTNGVYQLDPSCTNALITISADNVEILGSGGTNDNVRIECTQPTNLHLKDYNVTVPGTESAIRFSDAGTNTLEILGTNLINNDSGLRGTEKATVYVGGGLTIGGSGSLETQRCEHTNGAVIGGDARSSATANSKIVINGNDDNTAPDINLNGAQVGAAIGAGVDGAIGNITINGGKIRAVAGAGTPAIGTGSRGQGSGSSFSSVGNSTVGTITINGGDITALRAGGGRGDSSVIGVADGGPSMAGLKINGGKVYADNSSQGNALDKQYLTQDQLQYLSSNEKVYDQDLPNFSLDGNTTTKFNPLWIQHGTQSGQRIHCYINSMQTKDLGIDEAEVTTRDKAISAIAVIESALAYALNEATTQGAYLQRLEYTDSNVTIMGENVQNSESTIRDADMAKGMTEYTKYNILSQSSQAMLAQSNQNGSAILGLLQ